MAEAAPTPLIFVVSIESGKGIPDGECAPRGRLSLSPAGGGVRRTGVDAHSIAMNGLRPTAYLLK